MSVIPLRNAAKELSLHIKRDGGLNQQDLIVLTFNITLLFMIMLGVLVWRFRRKPLEQRARQLRQLRNRCRQPPESVICEPPNPLPDSVDAETRGSGPIDMPRRTPLRSLPRAPRDGANTRERSYVNVVLHEHVAGSTSDIERLPDYTRCLEPGGGTSDSQRTLWSEQLVPEPSGSEGAKSPSSTADRILGLDKGSLLQRYTLPECKLDMYHRRLSLTEASLETRATCFSCKSSCCRV